MSIPNLLTLFRLATAPLFLAVFVGSGKDGFLLPLITPEAGLWICVAIVALSELSDIFDGILARSLNQVSDFGKLLDPYADSTFRMTCFFSFASQAHGKWVPLWMVMVLFYRDLLVTVIRTFGVERREFVHARASGKIKAIAQGSAVVVTLLTAVWFGADSVAYQTGKGAAGGGMASALMWVVTAVTLWSAADYFWANRHLFTDAAKANTQQTDAEEPRLRKTEDPPLPYDIPRLPIDSCGATTL